MVTGWDAAQRTPTTTRWHEGEVHFEQRTVRTELSEIAGCRFGYAAIEDAVVCFVHRGLDLGRLAVRRLPQPADGYRIDPASPQPVAELEREWNEFFRNRPDLDPDSYQTDRVSDPAGEAGSGYRPDPPGGGEPY